MEDEKFKWIPWQRYVFILNIDGKDYFLGRYRRREGLIHRMDDLNRYAGYKARIVDTKKGGNYVISRTFRSRSSGSHYQTE